MALCLFGWVLSQYLIPYHALFCSTVDICSILFSNVTLGDCVLQCVFSCSLTTVIPIANVVPANDYQISLISS